MHFGVSVTKLLHYILYFFVQLQTQNHCTNTECFSERECSACKACTVGLSYDTDNYCFLI